MFKAGSTCIACQGVRGAQQCTPCGGLHLSLKRRALSLHTFDMALGFCQEYIEECATNLSSATY